MSGYLGIYHTGQEIPFSSHNRPDLAHTWQAIHDEWNEGKMNGFERHFGLPTLASVNHQFDSSTPGMYNEAAGGNESGPPAPPRDHLSHTGDFYEVLDFSQDSDYHPSLPSV